MKKKLIALAVSAALTMTSAGSALAQEAETGAALENFAEDVMFLEAGDAEVSDDPEQPVQEPTVDEAAVSEAEEMDDKLILEIEEIIPEEAEEPTESYEEVLEFSLEESGSAEHTTLPVLQLFANTQYTTSYGVQLTGAARTIYNQMEAAYAELEKTYADPNAAYTGAEGQTLPSFSYVLDETEAYSCYLTQAEYKDQSLRQSNEDYVDMMAQLKYVMQAAYDAYIYDHPEAYWLGTPTISVRASATPVAGKGYLYEIISSEDIPIVIKTKENYSGFLTALTVYQANVAQAVTEIRAGLGTGASRYEIVKAIHDYLCERLSYDHNYQTYASDTLSYKKVHTVAGVFVSEDHQAVCDGYARSFKVLCDQFGIECVVVPGRANEAHAWNYVKMEDGNYYLVDVTWDDKNPIQYSYFLIGSETVPNGTTVPIGQARTVYTRFSEATYTMDFAVPLMSAEAYDPGTVHVHSFTNYVSDGNATCTEDGTKTATCVGCDATDTVSDPGSALGHSFTNYVSDGNATCTTEGTKTAVCDRCGRARDTVSDSGSTLEHNWQKGALQSEATVFAPASRAYVCSRCNRTEIRTEGSALPRTMQLNVDSLTLKQKQSTTAVSVSGLAKGDSIVSWTSSDKSIVTVNAKGKITAKSKNGSAKVTVTLASGLTGVIKVKVQSATVKTTKISGVSKKLTLKKGQKLTLTPVLTPITSGQKLTYTSSNKKVVTVSSGGVLQARKAGKATIRVSSGSKTVKCTVTVK
jgi:hypothetical protein